METLLTAIQSTLRTALTDVRDGDVFLTPDLLLVPEDVRFPCVGLKDGQISRDEQPCGLIEITADVKIGIYVQILRREKSFLGDTTTGTRGIFQIARDVHETLDNNLLNYPGLQSVTSPGESASELFDVDRQMALLKIIDFTYTIEREI